MSNRNILSKLLLCMLHFNVTPQKKINKQFTESEQEILRRIGILNYPMIHVRFVSITTLNVNYYYTIITS